MARPTRNVPQHKPDAGPEASTVDQTLGAELAGLGWPMHLPEATTSLSAEVHESESLQMLFTSIRGQIGFQVCRCEICG